MKNFRIESLILALGLLLLAYASKEGLTHSLNETEVLT